MTNKSTAATVAGVAAAAYIDDLGVRREVSYLVSKGMSPEGAVERVVELHRKTRLWGFIFVPVFFWSLVMGSYGLSELPISVAKFWIRPDLYLTNPVQLTFPVLCLLAIIVGFGTIRYMFVVRARMWRTAAKGISEVDAQNPNSVQLHSPFKSPAAMTPQRHDNRRVALAVFITVVLVLVSLTWVLPSLIISIIQSIQIVSGGAL